MKLSAILILILFSTQSFSQTGLENAYKKNSDKMLSEVFEHWVKNAMPIDNNTLSKKLDFEKYAYEIFIDFYTPKNLKRIGKSEWGEGLYGNIKYAFVQNEVVIEVYDNINQKKSVVERSPEPLYKLKLIDFRPNVKVPNAKVIYLDTSTEAEIEEFLKNESTKQGNNNIMSPAAADGESEKRLEFINKYTKIFYGHWGGYWQIETYPTISIRFNKEFSKAEVDFRLVYEGGTAYYDRLNNKWKLKNSSLTWIE